MKKIAFFDTKPYDKVYFDKLSEQYGFTIKYFENKLNADTAMMAAKCDAAVAFVNDDIDKQVIDTLYENGINILAMRCAGYNNVDFKAAYGKVHVTRVPVYSPHAIAEHAMALLLTINRKIHKAYTRTRDFNFSINGFTGFDLYGKTAGIIGTGKIGETFAGICKGFGMRVLAYDPYPKADNGLEYVSLDQLLKQSDVISLHCPLTKQTKHIINKENLSLMKDGVYIINTSRGSLIDSQALLEAIRAGKVGGAGLDVYEEESELFYEDFSNEIPQDDILSQLIAMPNVIVTSHQAFLTEEALESIAKVTMDNLKAFFDGQPLTNEVCYHCGKDGQCRHKANGRCF